MSEPRHPRHYIGVQAQQYGVQVQANTSEHITARALRAHRLTLTPRRNKHISIACSNVEAASSAVGVAPSAADVSPDGWPPGGEGGGASARAINTTATRRHIAETGLLRRPGIAILIALAGNRGRRPLPMGGVSRNISRAFSLSSSEPL